MFHTKTGTPCFHEAEAISLIEEIISNFDPEVVVELGTKHGGFTEILQDITKDTTPIYSYDHMELRKISGFRSNVYFIVSDILLNPQKDIEEICGSDKRVLLYCDNGNKTRELELYAKYLKKGDMLGVHDWGTEVFYDKVKDYLKSFTFIRRKEFKNSGWKTRFWRRG